MEIGYAAVLLVRVSPGIRAGAPACDGVMRSIVVEGACVASIM